MTQPQVPRAGRRAAEERLRSPAPATCPRRLAAARVDLVEIIRNGIPERQFVPGCEPWLISAKRYLLPAPAGTGKSLAAAVIARRDRRQRRQRRDPRR